MMVASGCREQVIWSICSCSTGVGVGGDGVCSGGTLGGVTSGMRTPLRYGVGCDTYICVTGMHKICVVGMVEGGSGAPPLKACAWVAVSETAASETSHMLSETL